MWMTRLRGVQAGLGCWELLKQQVASDTRVTRTRSPFLSLAIRASSRRFACGPTEYISGMLQASCNGVCHRGSHALLPEP